MSTIPWQNRRDRTVIDTAVRPRSIGATIVWVVLVWGAFGYHLIDLTKQSLWPDEIYSVDVSGWTLSRTWTDLVSDHVPLYTILLGAWRYASGSSEFGLRYLSVVLATVSVPIVVSLAQRYLDRQASFVAGGLLAISPFQIYYAQEVVTYAFLGLLVLLASAAFLRWSAKPPWKVVLLQGALYAAIAYTHYAGLFVIATHVALGLGSSLQRLFERHRIVRGFRIAFPVVSRRWLLAGVIGVVLFSPWFIDHLTAVSGNVGNGTSKSLITLIRGSLVDLTFGYSVGNHLDLANPTDARVLGHLAWLSLVLPVTGILAILPRRHGDHLKIRAGNVVAFLHVVIPFGLLLLLVQGSRDFSSRYGFAASMWVTILIAAGLWNLRAPLRWLGVVVVAGFSLWGSLLYFEHPGFARLDFRAASSYIVDHLQPGDGVIVTAPYVASTFDYYSAVRGSPQTSIPLPSTIPADEPQTSSTIVALSSAKDRLWRLRWQDDYADPRSIIPRLLEASAIRESQRDLGGGLRVDLWLTRAPIVDKLPTSAHPGSGQLGDQVRLVGYELTSDWPGVLTVTLYWSLNSPLQDDYTVFVHLIDSGGRTAINGDSQPYEGQFPTSRWPAGSIVRDVQHLPVPACAPTGPYEVETGLYLLHTMKRIGNPPTDAIRFSASLGPLPNRVRSGWLLQRLPTAIRLDERLPPGSAIQC